MTLAVFAPNPPAIVYGPDALPGSWTDGDGNTHRLDAMTPEERAALGWLDYSESRPALAPHQKMGEPTYVFDATSCMAVYDAIDMTPEEAAAADTNQWAFVRDERDSRLLSTDWVGIRAYEISEPMPQEWKDYRQALRDITTQADPFNIVWPVPPPAPTAAGGLF